MRDERGAVLVGTEYGAKMYLQINLRSIICWALLFVIGAAGTAWEAVARVKFPDMYDVLLLVCFCIIAVLSLFLAAFIVFTVVAGRRITKRSESTVYSDCVVIAEYEKGEKTSEVKVYYNTLVKKRESKSYFFLYISRGALHALCKLEMTPAEQNAVRRALGLPLKRDGGGEELFLPPYEVPVNFDGGERNGNNSHFTNNGNTANNSSTDNDNGANDNGGEEIS